MNTTSNTEPLSELEILRARVAELEGKKRTKNISESKIQQDEYIPVMSLIPFPLNLTTREGGQGSIKKFRKFGEIKKILYRDLIDIIDVHPNFLEAGYFYIMHPAFIRQNGLDDIYSKILTKENIERILTTLNSEECIDLYNSANEKQQEIIVELLIKKLIENPDSLNLNVVSQISRVSKIDIVGRAESSKMQKPADEDTE